MSYAAAMDLEKPPPPSSPEPETKAAAGGGGGGACSICLDPVMGRGERSIARLQCGHEFHLDCIGSAFNAKGAMQCPNCRKVEKGRWLYSNGHRSSADFEFGGWVASDAYDFGTSELPFGFPWCPFSGFHLTSMFEESEPEPTSYHAAGDHSSASSSSHVCPYLALRGFIHPMHVPSSSHSNTENASFHRHPTGMEGQPTTDMNNIQIFHPTEPRNHDREQQYLSNVPLSGIADHSALPFGVGLSRYDSSSQQRTRPFVHPHPLLHRPTPRNGSNFVAPLGSAVMGETRSHAHSTRGHGYHQSMPSSMQSSPFPPTTRRVRPRALTITSFIAASSSAEIGGPHGFSVSGTMNRNLPDGEGIARHADLSYGWGPEGFNPLPWIPVEDESRWWRPFNPIQSHQHGSFTRRPGERIMPSHPENGYQHMPLPRMPPFL